MQPVTQGNVGQYLTESAAARNLDSAIEQALACYGENPADAQHIIETILAAINNGQPSKTAHTKRELWVLQEVMCWHHMDQFTREDLGTLDTVHGEVRTLRAALTGIFWGNRPGVDNVVNLATLDFSNALAEFWNSALKTTVNAQTTLFNHKLLQPIVARTYELRHALNPWDIYTTDPTGQLNDLLRTQLAGADALATTTNVAFGALAELAAASNRTLTAPELTEIALASQGLSRTLAGGSDTVADEMIVQTFYRERFGLELENGVARFPKATRANVIKTITAAGANPTTDVFGLDGAVLGCPAGKAVRMNVEAWGEMLRASPGLQRAHTEMALLWGRAWEIGTPQLPEINLGALGIDATEWPNEAILRDLPNTTVRIVPSLSRRLHISTDNDAGLSLALENGQLTITGNDSAPHSPRHIDVHMPVPPKVSAHGVSALDLEYVSGSQVHAPPTGKVRIRLLQDLDPKRAHTHSGAPVWAHEIMSGPGAHITLYGDSWLSKVDRAPGDRYVHFSDQAVSIDQEQPVTVVNLFNLGQRHYEEMEHTDPQAFAALNEELPWLARHVSRPRFNELAPVRALAIARKRGTASPGQSPRWTAIPQVTSSSRGKGIT
ncbi:MAG: hypothetical protein HOQ05_06005 [Corynebacteriales bacterium]|nr:hypothetical protein [Mycobacteriales bacterium]